MFVKLCIFSAQTENNVTCSVCSIGIGTKTMRPNTAFSSYLSVHGTFMSMSTAYLSVHVHILSICLTVRAARFQESHLHKSKSIQHYASAYVMRSPRHPLERTVSQTLLSFIFFESVIQSSLSSSLFKKKKKKIFWLQHPPISFSMAA